LIDRYWRTANRPASYEGIKSICGFSTATILQAIVATAELIGLGRVDTRQSNARPMNLDCVAVNDRCLPD
jgi:hypothetical protein